MSESEEERKDPTTIDVCLEIGAHAVTIDGEDEHSWPIADGAMDEVRAALIEARPDARRALDEEQPEDEGRDEALDTIELVAPCLETVCPPAWEWLEQHAAKNTSACFQLRVRGSGDIPMLPWELMWSRIRTGKPDPERRPLGEFGALTGAYSILRELEDVEIRKATPFGSASLKVLLLVGDFEQTHATYRSLFSVQDTVKQIQKAMADADVPASLTIAADVRLEIEPGLDVERVPLDGGQRAADAGEGLAWQLGKLLESGFDVVHFVGHHAPGPDGASLLQFGGPCGDLSAVEFARVLGAARRTRVAVLHACRSLDFVSTELLQAVDHVVTMQTMVTPRIADALCRGFYGELAKGARIGRAMYAARERIVALSQDPATAKLANNWWVPALWSAVHGDPQLVDRDHARLVRYLKSVVADHKHLHRIQERSFDSAVEQVPATVSIRAVNEDRGPPDPSELDQEFERRKQRELGVADLLTRGERRWAIEGKPGYGKTTSLRHLARRLAKRCLAELQGVRPEGEASGLPVLVPLYVALRGKDGAGGGTSRSFVEVAAGLDSDEPLRAQLEELLAQGRAACLIDGLDEVVGDQKQATRTLFGELARPSLTGPAGSAVLVTTRPAGFEGLGAYDSAVLEQLSRSQQRVLLSEWSRSQAGRGLGDDFAEAVLEAAGKSNTLEALSAVPLFLVLMAVKARELRLNGKDVQFAEQRHVFFAELLESLRLTQHRPEPLRSPLLHSREAFKLLADIARNLSENGVLRAGRDTVADWIDGRRELKHWDGDPERFLVEVATKTAIFAPPGGNVEQGLVEYEFLHRSFQEALTAKALVAEYSAPKAGAQWVSELVGRKGDELEAWREPIALMAAHYGKQADSFLSSLLDDEATRKIGLAALACAEAATLETLVKALAGSEDFEERLIVYRGLTDRFGRGAEAIPMLRARIPEADVEERWHLDQVLAALEDGSGTDAAGQARSGLLVLPGRKEQEDREELRRLLGEVPGHPGEALWCLIEPGEFWMGSPEGEKGRDKDERQFKAKIKDRFWMGAVPVTTEQFALFSPKDPDFNGDHLPMNAVSWFDAALYCRWLTERLRTFRTRTGYDLPGLEDRGELEARLPSEAEWEFAARAGTTGPFSSGTELTEKVAVFGRNYSDGPDVVGGSPADPRTQNPAGLRDVHGNIWEWCADWYGAYPEVSTEESAPACLWRPPASGSARVLRGGCFDSGPQYCRSAFRLYLRPGNASGNFGFRVVLAAPVH